MMCLRALVHTADSSVSAPRPSKVRNAEMPQQYDLERLISNVTNQHVSWKVENSLSLWRGVSCNDLNRVEKLAWKSINLSGTLLWEHMPKSTLALDFQENSLSGKIHFDLLPPKLESMILSRNRFTGPIDLRSSPDTLMALFASVNLLSGELFLGDLNPKFTYLYLMDNQELEGTIYMSQLPFKLQKTGHIPGVDVSNTKIKVMP